MTNIALRKQQLENRRTELEERLRRIDSELESHDSKDWEELATEREEDEVLERLGLTGQQELERIAAALDRVKNDTYGFCVKCGAEISQERLDVLPYTPFCRKCA